MSRDGKGFGRLPLSGYTKVLINLSQESYCSCSFNKTPDKKTQPNSAADLLHVALLVSWLNEANYTFPHKSTASKQLANIIAYYVSCYIN